MAPSILTAHRETGHRGGQRGGNLNATSVGPTRALFPAARTGHRPHKAGRISGDPTGTPGQLGSCDRSATQDADTEHPRPGFSTWAVAAPRREHDVAARTQTSPSIDELACDHKLAFLTFVHVYFRPFGSGREVIHPARAHSLAGRRRPTMPGTTSTASTSST
jgi:hypothetical protein